MKKLLIILLMLLFVPQFVQASEDIIPEYVSIQYTNTIGVYQAPNEIILYQEPSESSNIVHSISWINSKIFPETVNAKDLFIVHMPDKNLAFLAVSDETEEWVEVIYNNSTGAKGWIKKDDPYRFMSWIMFYNVYGRKYGLNLLKEAPRCAKDIRVGTDEYSQIIGTVNMPQKINLTAMKGNWALVSVFDIDKTPKTGYVRWRSNDGVKYYFPAMKN